MSEAALDHVVKGTPPADVNTEDVKQEEEEEEETKHSIERDPKDTSPTQPSTTQQTTDPTTLLPSSPPQIYLNLLILEASLRTQYLTLRARRRQNTCVLFWLAVWIVYFSWTQFFRPREDGNGVGGSPYWLVDMGERVALISGCMTGILFWVTGQWERGIRWPRRWFVTANRGLRGMNCKIVLLKRSWWREFSSQAISWFLPISWFYTTPGSNYQGIEYSLAERRAMAQSSRLRPSARSPSRHEVLEEDIAPGGNHLQIHLVPKHFTAEFRENWEIYRAEFWEHENDRRRQLRKRLRRRQREIAREQGGWLWWTGWRGWAKTLGLSAPRSQHDLEKVPPHHVHSLSHNAALRKTHARRPSALKEKELISHSRSSSRSSTASPDLEDPRERRWSTSTTGSIGSTRRRKAAAVGGGAGGDLNRAGSITRASMKMTPGVVPTGTNMTLRSQGSGLSNVSFSSDDGGIDDRRRRSTSSIKAEPMD